MKCPACGRLDPSDLCERCGTDLSVLKKIMGIASVELENGIAWLKKSDGMRALSCARSSWRLKNSQSAAKVAFMACILLKKNREAAAWYNRIEYREAVQE